MNYNFRRGIDLPSWHWLNQFSSGPSYTGTSSAYDGSRYVYWAIQYSVAAGPGAGQLWRFDTWTNGWQYLAPITTAAGGLDLDYDQSRGVLWVIIGGGTAWYYFNCNAVNATVFGVVTAPFAFSAAMTTVLPVAAASGANLDSSQDEDIPANMSMRSSGDRATGTATAASTTTSLTDATAEFHAGMVGCYVRMTGGTAGNVGSQRVITAVPASNTLTLGAALANAPAAGDTFVLEVPGGNGGAGATGLATTGGSTTTVVMSGAAWPVNVYRDADVLITSGALAGQRRRIASNTSDTLTLAAATAGNARTGALASAPVAGVTFRIMPSEDFLYYSSNTANLYRVDCAATAISWTTLTAPPAAFGTGAYMARSGGFAPFSIVVFRGGTTSTVYRYDVGLATWATLPSAWGAETLTTGGTVARMKGRHRFALHVSASSRLYTYNPVTGALDAATMLPYAVPVAYDGKRMRFIRSADGAEYIYLLRSGGQEFWRLPVEWMG